MSDLRPPSLETAASTAEFLTFGFRTPPNPVSLAPEMLERIHALHRLVRAWVKGPKPSADPRFDTTPTLLYVDLLFAFALAKVGAPDAARTLVETARRDLAAEPPVGQLPLLRGLLFRCYESRIADALANRPLAGPLPPELFADIAAFVKQYPEDTTDPDKPFGFEYVFSRLWSCSRVLTADGDENPYREWMKHGDQLNQRLAQLYDITNPTALATAIRHLWDDKTILEEADARLRIAQTSLSLLDRAGGDFTREFLALIPELLKSAEPTTPYAEHHRLQVLRLTLSVGARNENTELVRQMCDLFVSLALSRTPDGRLDAFRYVFPQCVLSLAHLGSAQAIDQLINRIAGDMLDGSSMAEVLARLGGSATEQARTSQAYLALAGGWLTLDRQSEADQILGATRVLLLAPKPGDGDPGPGINLSALDFARLAGAYLEALGHGTAEAGLPRLIELFEKMDPNWVFNTFTTRRYYSRLHLDVVEAAALSVVRMYLGRT